MADTKLSVNVNKIALLRNSRDSDIPSVLGASRAALDAGAVGITIHPRPDQRHIRPQDVDDIAALLKEPQYAHRQFNIEGNPFLGDYMNHCRRVRPTQATLVPDDPNQKTSDHGFILDDAAVAQLQPVISELQSLGCRVSLFMDPDPAMIERAALTGTDRIELYTESYARAPDKNYAQFKAAAAKATSLGLGLNAGHDLDLANLAKFVTIANILEVSIGHALIADALHMGMQAAAKAYLRALG